MAEQDWPAIGKALLATAIHCARTYGFGRNHRLKAQDEILAGNALRDIVQNVIVSVIDGRRAWDPARGDLLPFLRAAVNTEISHLAGRAERRRGNPDILEELQSHGLTPEQELLSAEERTAREARVAALLDDIEDDDELVAVYDLIVFKEIEPRPRFLAQELNWPVSRVNNALKRLRRCAIRTEAPKHV